MKVYYFSATGHCREIAAYFAHTLAVPMEEIAGQGAAADTAIVIFPVYNQSLPEPVRRWLPNLRAHNVVLVAAYGRMHPGNALSQAARLCRGRIIAGANIPTGHSYVREDFCIDFSRLAPLLERIAEPRETHIPSGRRQIFALIFPGLRSRLGVKIHKNEKCLSCGLCDGLCPQKSMKEGRPGGDCIRCLRCVCACPKLALRVSLHPLLRGYLARPRHEEYELYV